MPEEVSKARLRDEMIALAAKRGSSKTICPSEVARAVGGSDPDIWRPLMAPIKVVAVALAKSGEIEIRKSGARVDPDSVEGIYRIAIAERGGE